MELLKAKEDPLDLFRDLLNLICTSFPAEDSSQDGSFVRVSCSSHGSNAVSVSTYGFLLLEAAESAMASTEQNLELVVVDTLSDHLLSAVASRLARQQGFDVDTKVVVRADIQCQGEESAIDISSLMQNCRSVEVRGNLQVSKDIGKDGWAALREALSWRLHDIPHLDTGRKSNMAMARREDLRAIWECLSLSWRFMGDHEVFAKQRGEEGWAALEKFLDLTNEEWMAAKRAMGEQQVQVLFVGGEPLDLPGVHLDNVGPVAVGFGGQMMVEVQMQQPGGQGLMMAMQEALAQLAPEAHAQVVGDGPFLVAPVAQVGEGGEGQGQVEEGQDQEGDGEGQEGDGLLELALAVAAQGSDEDEEGDGNQ